ncbi:hypothetical protein VNO78_21325 [Psophocarpus tetragonolobus]|uniref:Uncharacterized protein n=1 Tax=Psophocarpus tetragonolobus TaxID=3891 RepID=A0AAN9XHY5_PSOTE
MDESLLMRDEIVGERANFNTLVFYERLEKEMGTNFRDVEVIKVEECVVGDVMEPWRLLVVKKVIPLLLDKLLKMDKMPLVVEQNGVVEENVPPLLGYDENVDKKCS